MSEEQENLPMCVKAISRHNSSQEVQDIYDEWAHNYNKDMSPGTYTIPSSLASHLESVLPKKDVRILDIGAGTGLLGRELAHRGFDDIDALDPNKTLLEQAKKLGIYQNFIIDYLGANRLNVDDDTYDVIIGSGCFVPCHVTWECFPELLRITKPGGLIIISSNERYADEESGCYLVKLHAEVERYEQLGYWSRQSHEYIPNLGKYNASVLTMCVQEKACDN